jgi:hypothetical protein
LKSLADANISFVTLSSDRSVLDLSRGQAADRVRDRVLLSVMVDCRAGKAQR